MSLNASQSYCALVRELLRLDLTDLTVNRPDAEDEDTEQKIINEGENLIVI